jgi:hypothetical protein
MRWRRLLGPFLGSLGIFLQILRRKVIQENSCCIL